MTDLRAEYLAAELLSRQSHIDHGLWVKELDFGRRIVFDTFENYRRICGGSLPPSVEGCTLRGDGFDLILYNQGWDVPRINYTLAHEVGHILLGHEDGGGAEQESEANRFASALIVPYAPLRALGRVSARQVADYFGCSLTAASVALGRPNVVTPYDGDVLRLFSSVPRKRNPLDISYDL